MSYEVCRSGYKYVYQNSDYPDTCTETTPACSSSSNVGNIQVKCVNE